MGSYFFLIMNNMKDNTNKEEPKEEDIWQYVPDWEIQQTIDEWAADEYLSSMDAHDKDYIDSGL